MIPHLGVVYAFKAHPAVAVGFKVKVEQQPCVYDYYVVLFCILYIIFVASHM